MNNLVFAAFILLAAFNAWADEQPCQREANGRISCTEAGFKTLTDAIIGYRGAEEKCLIENQTCVMVREATEASLVAAEARVKVAEDKLASIKPASNLRPVLAVAGAVLGSAALTSAVLAPLDTRLRLALGAGGLTAVSLGFVFVLPERNIP